MSLQRTFILLAIACFLPPSLAQTTSSYSPDSNTLFLFHLDESTGSLASNAVASGWDGITTDQNGTTITQGLDGAAGHFSNAASLNQFRAIGIDADGSGSFSTGGSDRFPLSALVGADQAFTLEALVKPDSADFGSHSEIWCADSVVTNSRGFQFRIKDTEELEYNGLDFGGGNVLVPLPNLQAGAWFHVALTYTEAGQTAGMGRFIMYWTPLDGTHGEAQVLHEWLASAITPNISSQLVLGNEGRSSQMTEGFLGLIDEARISNIARTATDFIFFDDDFDLDGLSDAWEQQIIDADPGDSITTVADVLPSDDFDSDGLTNLQEYQMGTDPTVPNDPNDIDGDGLPDSWEIGFWGSISSNGASDNPDGDGYDNLEEYQQGRDPTVYDNADDTDSDGLPDTWETTHFGALGQDSSGDFDNDGSSNGEELAAGTNPVDPLSAPGDGDQDGISDDWELAKFGSLTSTGSDDPDGDTHDNHAELLAGTDPNDPLDDPGVPADPYKPTGQMVDLLAFPHRTTIPDTSPEFSWIFHPAERGETQSAYEIIVSSTGALCGAGSGDVWSSGTVLSADSVDIPLGSGPLTRGATYFWRVRTWGNSSIPGSWSGVQSFTIESTSPPAGGRSINNSSSNLWSGRYQPAFDTTVVPVKIVDKGGGNLFIDFGKAAFGYISLNLDGSFLGQSMEARFGEKANGFSVDTSPGGTIRYGSTTVALRNGPRIHNIHIASTTTGINLSFTGGIMPFRYVELINCPATITAADLRQHALHVPFDAKAASFSSSDPTLDAVWDLCRYSMKATTFAGVYVDGDRERKPYEADAYINQLSHYGIDREFTLARHSYEYLLDHPTWPTEWRLHFPLMAWADYMQTGNKDALEANYDSLQDQLFLHWTRSSDGLFQSQTSGTPRDIVDWPTTERDGYSFTNINTVVNAFHYKALRLMAQIATELGETADAADYTSRADTMEASFNSVFWNGALYQDGESATHVSAHANFFPMAMGLVPDDRVAAVMSFLKTKRMACSVYGAQYLMEALFEGGEEDYAIGLMTDTDPNYKRHWWNMIEEGSTITMEAWGQEFKPNQDWNHAWGAVPGNIIPRYVLGLKPLTAGFGQVEIKPQLGTGNGTDGLTNAAGSIPTIRGDVEIAAENTDTTFRLRVKIPGNMAARVLVPTKGHAGATLLHNGVVVATAVEDGCLVLEDVPAGEHAIWLSDTATPDDETLKENWKTAMFGDDASDPAISGDDVDADLDGQTNSNEFVANTDPLDPADYLSVLALQADLDNDHFQMTVPGRAGRRYLLERTINLGLPEWITTDSSPTLTTSGDLILSDTAPPAAPSAFYRAAVLLP